MFKIMRVDFAPFAKSGDFLKTPFPMKPTFDITKATALRPQGHGPAAFGLLSRERGCTVDPPIG